MRVSIGLALAASAVAAVSGAALADAPPDRGYRGAHAAAPALGPRRGWSGARRRHGGYREPGFAVAAGPVYGREPRYYPGAGGASPNAGFGALAPVPVAVVAYREPYIGRGLIYNVPPEPTWAVGWSHRSNVISVKN